MATTVHISEFASFVGKPLGTSEPMTVTQEQVNLFADATGDHQWIHVDPERAKSGPFGGPIAHGYLTLSLLPVLMGSILHVDGVTMGVNYGCNKVRFSAPVPVGSTIQASATVAEVTEVAGGLQVSLDVVVEVLGATKPSCVAQVVYRYYA